MADKSGQGLSLDFDDEFSDFQAPQEDGFDFENDFLPVLERPQKKYDPYELTPFLKRLFGRRIGVFDCETDEFGSGFAIAPFTCGYYDTLTGDYTDFWGPDCIDQFFAWFKKTYTDAGIEVVTYCHNLGGFDLFFMLEFLDSGTYPTIINGRVSSARLGGQEWRDSYRIIPIPLSVYKKDDFDYKKMNRAVREKHREEILIYQRHDCINLAELVTEFVEEFGDRPTIGNTAISYLRSFHGFERMKRGADNIVRPFFHGGRCQSFKIGVSRGRFKVFDVTSMYPFVMKEFLHPVSAEPLRGRLISDKTAFVEWVGANDNAVPVRKDDGSLDFTQTNGKFLTSIHEFHAAEKLGLIRPRAIIQTIGFRTWAKFDRFINHFFEARQIAQAARDKLRDIFYKLIMNSAYGKFAQDPTKYEQFNITVGAFPPAEELRSETNPNGWKLKTQNGDTMIWSKPSPNRFNGYYNVATGASITGASRAVLLDGLSKSKKRLYCDTDSVICDDMSGVNFNGAELGGWKLEAEGEVFACAGKKLYALFTSDKSVWVKTVEKMSEEQTAQFDTISLDGTIYYCIKKACKGSVLSGSQIYRVAMGEEIRYKSDRPNFNLDGSVDYIERNIKRTG